MSEKVIQEFKIVETEDGFRIEIKGDKEKLRQMFGGMGPFGFRPGPGPFGFGFGPFRRWGRGPRWWGHRHGWGGHHGWGPGHGPWWEEEEEPRPGDKPPEGV